ncbi:hypothetical protein OIE49_36695 [Streptomyces sp. NBC_01788]|uniref:hypothetical protein n=1 Tax=Streptomyces sp. NBC_01788 TaxID=2975940 RepID=UPI002DDB351E|nr:hypothetical protein [Streptomyces sp. NBC_01788]WSB30931.1 hypothetical protein OIE49_36695 [Streptomyces sp. NBC_01788]
MSSLTDPLDEAQQFLIDTVWSIFSEHARFPSFFYVDYVMGREGYDATATLNSFPAVGTVLTHRYRAVGWWGTDIRPDREGPVFLTMAGLYHVDDESMADKLGRYLLAFMAKCSGAQRAILQSPFTMPPVDLHLPDYAKEIGAEPYLKHLEEVARREWPGVHYNEGSKKGERGLLNKASFSTVEDYLVAVGAELAPPGPSATLPYSERRALLRAINFLDVTFELVLGRRLVVRPPMDRSSLLALDVEDEAGFQAGLVVLTDILRDFDVPGGKPPSGLGRLERHLVEQLPSIDQIAVREAVERLDQIRVIRNSAVHPKPSPGLLTAHQVLGLPFPVRDFPVAWNSVRAHAEKELSRIQEAIQAMRP